MKQKRIATHPLRKLRREQAQARQEEASARTKEAQVMVLDLRLGRGVGAKRERARLGSN